MHPDKKRHNIFSTLFILSLCVIALDSLAQEKQYVQLRGNIYSKDSLSAIPFVTILESKSKTGVVSDANGYFSISLRPYDTILFSAIGYETYPYVVKGVAEKNQYIKILLEPQTYQLQEVGVYAIKNFKEFKKDFINLDLPEEEQAYIPPSTSTYTGNGQPTVGISGPFTKLYDKYSKRGKEQKKAVALRSTYDKHQRALDRYNRDFIVKVLGVEEEEADKVLSHCNFSVDYINTTNDYDLAIALQNCYTAYKKP
jgi:hypothetical protein